MGSTPIYKLSQNVPLFASERALASILAYASFRGRCPTIEPGTGRTRTGRGRGRVPSRGIFDRRARAPAVVASAGELMVRVIQCVVVKAEPSAHRRAPWVSGAIHPTAASRSRSERSSKATLISAIQPMCSAVPGSGCAWRSVRYRLMTPLLTNQSSSLGGGRRSPTRSCEPG